ncbi:MAG: 16S rRNA (adenine(1518)-N(6)/adenine(1519)-N(6))-dimethyltransferase, partial [Acidimicrobiia bacterium]|nr:16S rRNA (adenine(1518)-N(6)/adenine(1519)-N(6))-dimethyltransferase [Acidimicrobiia bacterium]
MTHSGADIRALLDRHGLEARRSLGQNFVVDPN